MKRNILVITALTLSLGLTACASTPKQQLVAQKNNDRMEEAAKEEPKQGTSLKEVANTTTSTYDFHYQNEDKTVNIVADQVPVTLPLKDSIPMYHVYSGELSQEFVTKVYDYFFPDGEAYVFTGTDATKDVLEQKIVEIKATIAQTKDDPELTEEEKQDIIATNEGILHSLEEEKKTAPEKSTLKLEKRDSTLGEETWGGLSGNFTTKFLAVTSKDQKRNLMVISAGADLLVSSDIIYTDNTEYYYSGGAEIPAVKCSDEEKNAVGISEEDARKAAEDFVSTVGMDWEIHDILLTKGYKEIESDDPDSPELSYAENYTAYKFIFAQCIDGIETAVTSSNYVPDEREDTYIDWLYESIYVTVDKNGIVEFCWNYPLMTEDTVSENVGILSFDEAADIFEQMMPLVTQGELEQWNDETVETTADITVTDVRLGLIRVRDSGSERKGLLTPVWLFYGDYTRNFHYKDYPQGDYSDLEGQPWILLAVNAVDGSVIDITAGY